MGKSAANAENILIHHPAFARAQERLEQCFDSTISNSEPKCAAIIGEFGTGKTTVLKQFMNHHPAKVLFVTVPVWPSVDAFAWAMIDALGADDFERTTTEDKQLRLLKMICMSGIRIIMVDDFQHPYHRDKHKTIVPVLEWLKNLCDNTGAALVVAGLQSTEMVLAANPQLKGRFLAPAHLPTFSWFESEQKADFQNILEQFYLQISKQYEIPPLHSEDLAFRLWCISRGSLACVSRVLRQAVQTAKFEKRKFICLSDLDAHHRAA